MKKLFITVCLLCGTLNAQTIWHCKQRFNTYLNFRGSLNGLVRFEEDVLYLLNGQGQKEYAIYREELGMLADFFEGSTVTQQEKFMKTKGTRKFTQRERDSISINTENKTVQGGATGLPLQGIKIAIDPGHFGTTPAEAHVEQKFLYFVKQKPNCPADTVRLFESSLTFNTATILRHLLEEQGATVFLTRLQGNYTSFNCTFDDWMDHHRKRVLDSLVCVGAMTGQKRGKLLKSPRYTFFWDFFRDFDLANRANKVNAFAPDVTVIIHYNVDEKNAPWKTHTRKNFSMAFIGGGFTRADVQKRESKMHFIRLLVTTQPEHSERLARETVKNFNAKLQIPIARATDALYLKNNSMSTPSQGVFCRNLILCRKINSPLVYGESLYQDNETECMELMKSDLNLYGIQTNERLRKVALSYFEAVMDFYKTN